MEKYFHVDHNIMAYQNLVTKSPRYIKTHNLNLNLRKTNHLFFDEKEVLSF